MNKTENNVSRAEINKRIWEAMKAARDNDLVAIKKLVKTREQANWLSPNRSGQSLLWVATQAKSRDVIKWLLVQGANSNYMFHKGHRTGSGYVWRFWCPFVVALISQDSELIALFLEHGADLGLPFGLFIETTCWDFYQDHIDRDAVNAWTESFKLARSIGAGDEQAIALPRRL